MSKTNLEWKHLTSPTMTIQEYLEQHSETVKENIENYQIDKEVVERLKKLIASKKEKVKIVALGADWCPDCSKNVPRMIKIVHALNQDAVEMRILYGIMVNALHRSRETIWHRAKSPPEATDPKFALKAIPSFYFFNKKGEFLDVIVEGPKAKSTLEHDTLEILEREL